MQPPTTFRSAMLAAAVSLTAVAIAAPGAGAATIEVFVSPGSPTFIQYTAAPGKINKVTVSGPASGPIRIVRNAGDDDPITVVPGPPDCIQNSAQSDYTCAGSRVSVAADDLADQLTSTRTGSAPDTTLIGGTGGDVLIGGAAAELLDGGDDADQLTGGDGDDQLTTGSGPDTANGGNGNDALQLSGGGADVATGGPGDDVFVTPVGPMDMRGGPGVDSVLFLAQEVDAVTPLDHSYTLDDQANDGGVGAGANAHSDIEDVLGATTLLGALLGSTDQAEGHATLVGDALANTLMGGNGDDDIDGAGGNDSLAGGKGNDTLRARDGLADRVNCGEGSDTAVVDQVDVVADNCEIVQTAEVPVPGAVTEDRPPTVEFTLPAAGAKLGAGPTVLSANAADDRGVARVQFLDDDRIVCTDTTAPYTCDYQPRGEDVGRNTLAVMAIDTSEQTATAVRTATVSRFAAALSLSVAPARDARAPYTFTSSGRLTLPASVTPALGCDGGQVTVQFKAGTRTVSTRRVTLRKDCTYRVRVSFRLPRRLSARSLRVQAIFGGNLVTDLARSSRRTVRLR